MVGMRNALALPALALVLALASALPSRIAIASTQSAGTGRAFYLAGGLLSDVAAVGPIFVVVIALLALLSSSTAAQADTKRVDRGVVMLLAVFAFALFTQNATAEFRIERGVLPGPIDLRQGMGHHDFFTAEAPLLVAGRFLWANLACLAIAVVVALRLRPALAPGPATARLRIARGVAIAVASCACLIAASRRADAYCVRMNNRDALASPSAALVTGLLTGARYDGSPSATRALLAEHVGAPADVVLGAHQLGYPPESASRLSRASSSTANDHPLARPLDPGAEAPETSLLRAARAFSRAAFTGATPIVFHVSLESARADDIHALHDDAPSTVAPFLDHVYATEDGAIAFARAHQSGVRTSQALGAVMCGLGALPFHISASRDLGALPLRCLPDVLADARFGTRVFYGHELVFDDMASFFSAHRMSLHERRDFPASAPRGVWDAVSDASVYDAAIEDADRAAAADARYSFVLTLSHHAPYTSPSDLSPPHRVEIDELCQRRGLHGENCERLATLRYADDSLRHFVGRVAASKNAARSLVVVAGDHTVHRAAPWGSADRPEGTTQIPFFVWLPPALRDRIRDDDGFSAAWQELRTLARTQPISSSDIPSLLLALVGESAPLRALPTEARWHTLGGQATSPHYRSVTGRGVIHGIDAHGFVFDVEADGSVHTGEIRMESLRGPADVADAGPHNRGEIAFLGSFLRAQANRR